MQFSTLTTNPLSKTCDCLIIFTSVEKTALEATDKALASLLKPLQKSGDFSGKKAETLLLHSPDQIAAKRLLLVGTGTDSLSPSQCHNLLKSVAKKVVSLPVTQIVVAQAGSIKGLKEDTIAQLTAQAFTEASYLFDQFKTADKKNPTLNKVSFAPSDSSSSGSPSSGSPSSGSPSSGSPSSGKTNKTAIHDALMHGSALGEGINVAKNLGDLPGNICTPTYLAQQAKALAKQYPAITNNTLNEKQLQELGMGSLLSVSAGSEQPAALIVMEYKGAKGSDKPIALVGKGVTFDSGGISLKSGAGMDEMKYDMCGAASVFGAMKAIAESKLAINVVAIVPAVENMPSGKATKPGDIVTSMSGKTIEVLNTDAEGRLILCDALSYAESFKPRFTIDIATLTGACVVALGAHATGLFSNDDELADALLSAGTQSGDRAWRMPLWEEYDKQLKSNFADMANIGGPKAGSVTAACFLARFTGNQRWAHLDIAGSAWNSGANKGATGRPVSLLVEFLKVQAG